MTLQRVQEVQEVQALQVILVYPLLPANLSDPWGQGCPSCQQHHRDLEVLWFLEIQARHSFH